MAGNVVGLSLGTATQGCPPKGCIFERERWSQTKGTVGCPWICLESPARSAEIRVAVMADTIRNISISMNIRIDFLFMQKRQYLSEVNVML